MESLALDRGADGPAALARPCVEETIIAEIRGSTQVGHSTARRLVCECQIDWLNVGGQISDRQWQAGAMFRHLWLRCLPRSRVCGDYGERVGRSGGLTEAEYGIDLQRRLARAQAVLEACAPEAAMVVKSVCGEDEKGGGSFRRLPHLQAGLDALAAHWKVHPDFSRRWARPR